MELKPKSTTVCLTSSTSAVFNFSKFKTIYQCIRHVALVRRFASNCRNIVSARNTGPLTSDEFKAAKQSLWKILQLQYFGEDVSQLTQGKPVSRSSKLHKLNPFMDETGTIRKLGRIGASYISYEHKHPIILPTALVTYNLIKSEHLISHHAGVDTLISKLGTQFQILGIRKMAKQVKRFCLPCQRQDAKACNEVGAPLPGDRIRKAPPFSITGVDYAGPLFCKSSSKKFYILIFTCAVVRAAHLELAPSLSVTDFMNCFRRFVARRGLPRKVYSDNAKTFIAATTKIQQLYQHHAPEWLHICPKAPWHGGGGNKWSAL